MRLGLLAYSTNTGLGIQTHEFYKNIKPVKTLVLDLSGLNGVEQHPDRYPDGIFIKGIPTDSDLRGFLEGLDLVFLCETPLNYNLFSIAREMGVKTVIQPNWEFLDYLNQPNLPLPDLFALPSKWHWEDFPFDNKIFLPVPVDKPQSINREVGSTRTFLHIAGRPAHKDRNGTDIVLEAAKHIPWARFIIRIQDRDYIKTAPDNVSVITKNETNYWQLYQSGDVLVMPRRYGGLCLPVNEALATGMPVIMPDIDPNNRWLPEEWLVPAKITDQFEARSKVDVHSVRPFDLADKIYHFAKMKNFGSQATKAKKIADGISWETLRPRYLKVFEKLCRS